MVAGGGAFGRQLDLDMRMVAAKIEFEMAGAGNAAAGGDEAGKTAAAAVDQLDVVRAEVQIGRPVRLGRSPEPDRPVLKPDLAVLERDGERVRLADEAEDEGRDRMVVDLVRRADLFDRALAHDDDAVGQFQRLLLVVGDEDRRVAGAVVDLAQPLAQFLPDLGVERAEGLVEQQHVRLDRHGAGERHALALAAGQLGGITFVEAGELHQVEQIEGPLADLSGRRPSARRAHLEAEGDVVEHGHVAEQGVVLEDEADVALLHRLLRGVLVTEEDRAAGRAFEPGDEAKQCRLAGAGGAKQRDQLAGADIERDVVERREAAEFLADVVNAHVHSV
ncbi:hypothetical protein D9M68_483180 [compost metagenome]